MREIRVPGKIWWVFWAPSKTDWLRRLSVCPVVRQRLKRRAVLRCLKNLCYWPETKCSRQAPVRPTETWTEKYLSVRWTEEVPVLTLLLSLLLDSSVTWPSGEACCSGWCSSVSTRPSGPRFPSHRTCWGRSVRMLGRGVSCSAQHPAVTSAAARCFLNTHTMLGKELCSTKSTCTSF